MKPSMQPALRHRPHDRQRTARGETRLAASFVLRDFRLLPFNQLAWRSGLAALLFAFMPVFGGTAHANCFKSVSLGEYPLGEWSDAGRTWVVSDTVGSFSDAFTTQSELRAQRDALIGQCSAKGNAVIAEVEKRLNERKADLGAEFDRTCTDLAFCPLVRDISIQSREREIDQEISRMQSWYRASIDRCEGHFNYMFNTLSPRICSQ